MLINSVVRKFVLIKPSQLRQLQHDEAQRERKTPNHLNPQMYLVYGDSLYGDSLYGDSVYGLPGVNILPQQSAPRLFFFFLLLLLLHLSGVLMSLDDNCFFLHLNPNIQPEPAALEQ